MAELVYFVATLYAFLCPYTKVEESFNIQAFHDILYHRFNLSQYDHNEFPGVVPRTFIGPLFISLQAAPLVWVLHLVKVNKFWMQAVVRLTLFVTVMSAWTRLQDTLQKQFGNTYAWWYTLITASQYHFLFYMSRPLPNIMVMPLVLLAFEGWLSGHHKRFLIWAGAGIIIFRSELAMLFGLFLIIDLYFKKTDVVTLMKTIVPIGVGLIALTFIVDSIFWGRPVWPEAEVFWYNTFMNKSSDWGTSPFLWYFYSALPRGLGPSLVLVPIGVYLDRRMVTITAPALVYIFLYSFLPHKELRFIIYVFPLLNMTSAAACTYIFIRRRKTPMYELLCLGTVLVVLGNVILSVALVSVAMKNYPGGVAIKRFHELLKGEPFVHVHIDNLAAQTGVTRFTESYDNWIYNKTESLEPYQLQEYTHLLIEAKSKYSSNLKAFAKTHLILETIETFSQISFNYKVFPPMRIKTKPSIFILERKDFRDFPRGHLIKSIESDEQFISAQTLTEESQLDVVHEINVEETDTLLMMETVSLSSNDYMDIEEILGNEPRDETINEEISAVESQETQEGESSKEMLNVIKAFDDLKHLRQERKQRAIEKIKSETRKEVVASAKEKLREIMKRHQHIAEVLSENIISEVKTETESELGSDVAESVQDKVVIDNIGIDLVNNTTVVETSDVPDDLVQTISINNQTDENVNAIVEEVIARLIDRKIYDDKTKPEDIKAEDRQMIQQIVEEVVSERMNYSSSNST